MERAPPFKIVIIILKCQTKINNMKMINLIILQFLLFSFISCEQEKNSRNGISYKLILLNEQEKEATIFSSGENITFSFRIENFEDDTIFFGLDFLIGDNFKIYNEYDTLIGKLYEEVLIDKIAIVNRLLPKNVFCLNVPWVTDSKFFNYGFYHFRTKPNTFLPKGKYYTTYWYHTDIGSSEEKIDNKLNFIIK